MGTNHLQRREALAGMIGMALGIGSTPVFAQNVRGVTANSIKIGVQVPLTGPVALSGEQIRAGEVAYMSMINDRGGVNGRKIELIIEDNEFSAQKGVTAVRKLVTRDNVFAMVGGNGVSQFNPVLPFLDEQQVPVINAYTGVVDWYNPVRQRVFGVYPPLEFSAQAIGRWAAKEGHKKILVAHFDAAIAVSFSKMIEPGAKTANPNVEVELMPVKLGTVDYTPIALEIMRKNPDVVIAANILQEFVALTKELRTQGSKVPVFTLPINVLQSVLALAPEPLEGVKALSFTRSPTADTPALKEYRDALAKYVPSQKADFVSLFTFAASKIFVEALSRVKGELTYDALYASLHSLKDYDSGILPPVTFSPTSHLGVTSFFKMIAHNGQWVATGELVDSQAMNW
ncbi:ABC transporter substrate-binding protein [Variovorax humicola]|uniref:ABC transporter substrate-binding protein n=1 Tax=Variovorax humicola TaxID=1769758 RepID=A0ABU8W7S3_9BURK